MLFVYNNYNWEVYARITGEEIKVSPINSQETNKLAILKGQEDAQIT